MHLCVTACAQGLRVLWSLCPEAVVAQVVNLFRAPSAALALSARVGEDRATDPLPLIGFEIALIVGTIHST